MKSLKSGNKFNNIINIINTTNNINLLIKILKSDESTLRLFLLTKLSMLNDIEYSFLSYLINIFN